MMKVEWKTQKRYAIVAAILAILEGCDSTDADQRTVPAWMGPEDVAAEESVAERSVLEQWQRRERYLTFGIEPDVPMELSAGFGGRNLEFVGYAPIAYEASRVDDESLRSASTCEEDLSSALQVSEWSSWGYFINIAGETWRWKPADVSGTLRDIRRKLPEVFIEEEVAEFVPEFGGHGEQAAAEDVWRSEGIIGTDNRVIRSAYRGYAMTSPTSPWMRIGGLPPRGWSPATHTNNSEGTASKIGPRHLLTAGHVMWDNMGFHPHDWWPGQDGVADEMGISDSIAPNGVKSIPWTWLPPKWYEDRSPSQDYSVLILYDNASSAQFPRFGFMVDSALAGEMTWNFGIPRLGYDCEDSPLDSKDCAGSMYGHQKSVRRTEVSYVFTAHDLQSGHSGGPVYKYNGGNRQIVAVAKSKYSLVENRHVKIRKSVFDMLIAVMEGTPSSHCDGYGWTGAGCD